jgi:hypothetical protein
VRHRPGRQQEPLIAGAPQLADDRFQIGVGTDLAAALRKGHALDGQLAAALDVPGGQRLGQVGSP